MKQAFLKSNKAMIDKGGFNIDKEGIKRNREIY